MPAGDAQRSWFPEMLEVLKESWSSELSWEECAQLCSEFTEMRTKIKKERGIRGAKMHCKNCGGLHEMGPPPIGIRSMLFALRKMDVLDDEGFSEFDMQWKSYRRKHQLDATGQPKEEAVKEDSYC